MNLGNPDEYTIEQFAIKIKNLVGRFKFIAWKNDFRDFVFKGSQAKLVYKDPVIDDPKQRRPDITLAKSWLNWEPKVNLKIWKSFYSNSLDFPERWS
jgi:UDP-glucuronate decarboxylase